MNFKKSKAAVLAGCIALGVAGTAAYAAEQPVLGTMGAQATAVFTGGATINGGASYLTDVPAADAMDLLVTIRPAAADVGQSGSLLVIVNVPGVGYFNMVEGGGIFPWRQGDPIRSWSTRELAAIEEITILRGIVAGELGIAGLELQTYVGYYTGNILGGTLSYAATPAIVRLSEAPAPGCPANTTSISGIFAGKPVCQLSGDSRITSDTHLTANNVYFINGAVFVGENIDTANADKISLTIDAGTTLFAPNGQNTLIIDKSARIDANGTPANPIIMTSEQDVEGVDALNLRGTWGGLVINGSATLNTQDGFDQGEGGTGQYGGGSNPVDDDDSGAVTYVQIKYAGWPITPEDELNSLALQGVGSGTILDYIQIHNGADDGVEFYGGTVNAKHLLLTGNDDDAVDWTTGYVGKLQHVLVQQTNSGDNCIEADNLGSNPTASPRSIPVIANLTCIGSAGQKSSGHAFELKAGTGMNMSNSLIGGEFPQGGEGCILIRGAETFTNSGPSIAELNQTLTMENSLITSACAADLQQGDGAPWTTSDWYGAQVNSSSGTVDLGGANGWTNGSVVNAVPANVPDDGFFDQVDHIGAIKDDASDWAAGWTFTDF